MAYFVEYNLCDEDGGEVVLNLSRAVVISASTAGGTNIDFDDTSGNFIHVAETYDRVKADLGAANLLRSTKD